jgi:hypothetical protein
LPQLVTPVAGAKVFMSLWGKSRVRLRRTCIRLLPVVFTSEARQ